MFRWWGLRGIGSVWKRGLGDLGPSLRGRGGVRGIATLSVPSHRHTARGRRVGGGGGLEGGHVEHPRGLRGRGRWKAVRKLTHFSVVKKKQRISGLKIRCKKISFYKIFYKNLYRKINLNELRQRDPPPSRVTEHAGRRRQRRVEHRAPRLSISAVAAWVPSLGLACGWRRGRVFVRSLKKCGIGTFFRPLGGLGYSGTAR